MNCYQLVEVAYRYEAALTPASDLDAVKSSWRLATLWAKGQPGFMLVDQCEQVDGAYSTFKLAGGGLYGLWVKPVDGAVKPVTEPVRTWQAREADAQPLEASLDWTVDPDVTPNEFLTDADTWKDHVDVSEVAGV